MYPYAGGATYLAALLPKWALEGGTPGLLRRLDVPEERTAIASTMEVGEGSIVGKIEWDQVLIVSSPEREHVGHFVSELAERAGRDPAIWMLDALRTAEGKLSMVVFLMSADNIRQQLRHEAMMLCTDGLGVSTGGPLALGLMHPRFFGTYPRTFGRYVREEGILTLEQASWKASGFPAQKLRLADRGVIREGYRADLVVLDPATVMDRATYFDPLQYPVGIDHVLVNGEVVVASGTQTSVRPGRVIRQSSGAG